MTDNLTISQRRHNMRRIRSTGTRPETCLGDILSSILPLGCLIIQQPNLPGKPDFYLPSHNLALFADGCFFHMCPRHFVIPETNRNYWLPKLERNKARDKQINIELRDMGLIPVRIWEHDLKLPAKNVRRRIRRALSKRKCHSDATCSPTNVVQRSTE
jgi:DNA mismatch endonuclease (patch repair protein)